MIFYQTLCFLYTFYEQGRCTWREEEG